MDARKILIIGNSHSVDAFHFLCDAYKDCNPNENIITGIAYFSGCSITQHIEFYKNQQKVYRYYKNNNGKYSETNEVDLKTIITDEEWDDVFLQAAKADLDDTLNLSGRRELESIVDSLVKTSHRFMWHTSWPSPNDETFFSPDYVRQPPNGYKENLIRLYGFNPVTQFSVLTTKAKEHILTDSVYSGAVCTGSAVMHAYLKQNCAQLDIWRDYTHLNDFGQLIVAYAYVAQLTKKPVTRVGINMVPQSFRHKQYSHLGDMQVTEQMKEIIIKAANYSLEHPF